MQVSTTELYGHIKAVPGRYVSHYAGDCWLCEADGTTVLGPVPSSMLDQLVRQRLIIYANHRYALPVELEPVVIDLDNDV